MIDLATISKLQLEDCKVEGSVSTSRYLCDLNGAFADPAAYETALLAGNPLVYKVAAVAPAQGEGQLHYGLGLLMPGKVGREYYLTKGHFHSWRPAAEVYIGLRGQGLMLLEDEHGQSKILPLERDAVVYVPGNTAHRTINTGSVPLVYLGVYPSEAGHDYDVIARRNFRCVVVEQDGRPVLVERSKFSP